MLGHRPPNLAQSPQINTGQLDTVVLLLVDVIGSIVNSLSRCCPPNDEGHPPKYFFLEPPLMVGENKRMNVAWRDASLQCCRDVYLVPV